ncbi:DUF3467 domain-containing protein [Candidatus Uhrbacteria bacterium]|nr:DUF3467 domain-containing protein [Candidatus Uhrbacteria bacterium]
MSDEQQQPQQQTTLHGETDELKGRYANAFSITSQERDVAIDFFSHVNAANQPAQLVGRIFLNHFTARDLIKMLDQTLTQWEKVRYERAVPPVEENKM